MNKEDIIISIISIILILIVVIAINSMTTVPTGFVGVKTRFGKVQEDVIQEGLNLKVPFIEKIVKIDCKTKKVETTAAGSTKDMQNVSTSIAVNYNVNKETANNLYREIGLDFENIIISPAIQESIKSTLAQYTAEELITKRSNVSDEIQNSLIEKIESKGFAITEFNLVNIDFSEEYDKAIETKAVRQQEVETAKAELEKQKIQNEKEISEAQKDAQVMALQNSQITENTLKLKELENEKAMIDKWNGQYPSTMLGNGSNTLFNLGGN